jgi:hypothetical protein
MPDEQTRWERLLSHRGEKGTFHARQRTDDVRRRQQQQATENPYRKEAARDRLMFRWAVLVVLLLISISLLVWQVFFA